MSMRYGFLSRGHRRIVLGAVSIATLALAACGTDSSGGGIVANSQAAASDTAAAGDNGSGEGSPIRFISARNHYQVDFPATMTEAADGSATASRGTEMLTVHVVNGGAAADVGAYAAADLRSVLSLSPGARVVSPLAPAPFGGGPVQKVVYTAPGSVNPVTGNAETLVTVRYYIPRDASRFAVLTYSITENQYDPQGADDVAMTFQWQ